MTVEVVVKPVLQFRGWDSKLWGCNRIEDDLFVIHPSENPSSEQAVFELSYLNANLLPDHAKMRATYTYDVRVPRAVFNLTFPTGQQVATDRLECQGWSGYPKLDKWSAEWNRDRKIWMITRWKRTASE